ncbi:MAG: hypothetical protein RMX68_008395 [Aulosira sp. ZfuVER01]|nr:hypothetical protein [Aulosira sp. ZfuVER01]MDZ7997584.1 hypothetical protein [Aulosira sp. DedVER01a]MDZ8054586.1 hypothetical protein [Aulosira sp. ZfuCHP01]
MGSQAGGTLAINASERLDVSGTSVEGHSTGLGAIVYPGATGNAGDLKINTGELLIRDGAEVGEEM